jgi:hypothetical protein
MSLFRLSFLFIAFLLLVNNIKGQGCSDAGFCTISEFKPANADSINEELNQLKVGFSYGSADHNIFVFGTYLEYNRKLSKRFGLGLKLTTLSQSGNDISTFGAGDIFVNGSYKVNRIIGVTLGFKIPLSDANKSLNQLPLPMDYQSSLGTFDLIFVAGFKFNNLQFVLAMQQPLTNNNNSFLSNEYPEGSALSGFQSTNKYIRSGDVLFRVSYVFNLGKKFKITPGLLPIYHLSNDKFTDSEGIQKEIVGSQGLTLNANFFIDYVITRHHAIQFNFGAPLIIRDARPDGLTRHYIFTLEYSYKF